MPILLPLALASGLTAGVVAFNKRKSRSLIKMLTEDTNPTSAVFVRTQPIYTHLEKSPSLHSGAPISSGAKMGAPAGYPLGAEGGFSGELYSKLLTTWHSLKFEQLSIFFTDSRGNHLQKITTPEKASKNPAKITVVGKEEQEVDHYLRLSITALGLAVAGVVLPPLSLLSGVFTLYSCKRIFRDAYSTLAAEGRLRWTVLDSISIIGTLAARYFLASALAGVIYFVGLKMMLKTEDHSRHSLTNIFGQQPRSVWVLLDGVEVEIPFVQVKSGDTLVVHTGQMIPVDGVVTGGTAAIDQHMLTGEAQPAEKGPGEPVFAATIVLAGRIQVQVEKAGSDTVAAQIHTILTNTADFRTTVQARWETLADRSVLPTFGLAMIALGLRNPVSAVAVLGSNYSPVLQVASPLGMLNFLRRASQTGILIKDGRALEVLSRVDTVIFDKTGTLTLPQTQVGQIYPCAHVSTDELLTYAAAVEAKQSHPLAQAILHAAAERNLPLLPLEEARYEVGYGIQARVDDRVVHVGSARYMVLEGIAVPADFQAQQQASHMQGASLVYVAFADRLAGAIELRPTLRPEVKTIVKQLQRQGLTIYIISGDQHAATQALATELGIERCFAEVLPQDKARLVEQLQQEGRCVCFMGDGINDAIALKKADVAISLRGASTLATNTAQIILMDESLKQLVQLFTLAHEFDINLKATLLTTFAPGLISLGGIFFFHTGIHAAIALYNLSMIASLVTGMLPALRSLPHPKHQSDA